MFGSIKIKILILQIGLVLTVAVSLGIISYLITFSVLRDSQKQNLKYLAEYISGQAGIQIKGKEELLEKIGSAEAITEYLIKLQENFMTSYFIKYMPEFNILSYADSNGVEQLKVINGRVVTTFVNINNSAVFQQAINNPNKTFSRYISFCSELGCPCVEFGYVNKSFFDEFLGFISGVVPVSAITKDIHNFKETQSIFAMLVDSEGTILACPDESRILKKLALEGKDSERIVSEIATSRANYGRVIISGVDSYIAYTPVEGRNWSVITVLPYNQFIIKLYALRNTTFFISLTVLIAGIIISLFLATDITRPILELVKGTGLIATGDFSQRVDISTEDEIGKLAQAFNQMAENLQNTTTSMVNLNREVTERQKAEKAQYELNSELEETVSNLTIANRELADFAHIAAHDLKAPLRAIGSLAGILLADYGNKLDERGRQYLDTLVKRTERMSGLIRGIMTYSEIGRAEEIQPVDLNRVICEVIAEMPHSDNIEIIQENNFPTVLCENTHMFQVFENLLSNAVKYMDKPKGYIRIAYAQEDEFWIFSVSDNGCGIEEKYHEKIFKIFQTLVRRDVQEGTGIGLSIVKKIIEKYNGKIWVESEPGAGSTFYFSLPKKSMEVKNEKYQTNIVS